MRLIIIFIILSTLFLIGCTSSTEIVIKTQQASDDVESKPNDNYNDPLFCNKDNDCKRYVTKWPCFSTIANKYANIKEDKCYEPCPRGISQAFCEWSFKRPVCENNKCTFVIECDKMRNHLTKNNISCDSYSPNYNDGSILNHMGEFCKFYDSNCKND